MTTNIADRGSWWRRWDLHIHTNASDGKGTCEEILEEAKKKKIRCIAVTDHHTFANIDEMKKRYRLRLCEADMKQDVGTLGMSNV